ncbi:MAG: hypothetical protein ABSG31_08265 [Tepidisphaeraceae bacterium]
MLTNEKSRKSERRQSERWTSKKKVLWRVRHGHQVRAGQIVERSLHGMVIAVDPDHFPPLGSRLLPADPVTATRHGFRDAVVRRHRTTDDGQNLVCVEILA